MRGTDYECINTHISLFLAQCGSLNHTELVSSWVTPLYVVKVPCLYAQLKTVITFHYCTDGANL